MADPLDDPALDLARGPERVDDAPDVVDRRDPLHLNLAGLDVHGDLDDVHPEREDAHPGRVRAARALTEDLRLLQHADDLFERRILREAPLLGDVLDLLTRVGRGGAHGGPHRRRRRGAGRDRRVRPARGIAEHDVDLLERYAELLRCDLRHRRAGAGADVLHRRDHGRAPV